MGNLLNTFIDFFFDSNQTQWVTIINKKRKAFFCTLWDLAAPGEKRYPNFPGIYKAKCIPSGASQGLGGREWQFLETQGICCLLYQAEAHLGWMTSHGVELKAYLLSKCIPACHKLRKTGCKWTKHGDEGTWETQEGSCMGLGLSLAGWRTDQSQKKWNQRIEHIYWAVNNNQTQCMTFRKQ